MPPGSMTNSMTKTEKIYDALMRRYRPPVTSFLASGMMLRERPRSTTTRTAVMLPTSTSKVERPSQNASAGARGVSSSRYMNKVPRSAVILGFQLEYLLIGRNGKHKS